MSARYEDAEGRAVLLSDVVAQAPSGRWVVARWDERAAHWTGPVTRAFYRATGLHAWFGRSERALDGAAGAMRYASRKVAVQAAIREFGLVPVEVAP